jgi:hypothetical protein
MKARLRHSIHFFLFLCPSLLFDRQEEKRRLESGQEE